MAKQRKKSDFPTKICLVCGLSFSWRKKWANCWDQVKYCSEKCRRQRAVLKISRNDNVSDSILRGV